MDELLAQIRRLHDRWKYYDEPATLEGIAELLEAADELEWNLHDECRSDDDVDQAVREKEGEMEDEIEELKGKISDLEADVAVYNERLKKGIASAILAEDFIFTPEDARAQFHCISGGASC